MGTDGSGHHPRESYLRYAGFGVYYGDTHPWNLALPVAGPLQTAQRGELLAMYAALHQVTGQQRHHFVLDSEYVKNGVEGLLSGAVVPTAWEHQDLWTTIVGLLARLKGRIRVSHFPSHIPQLVLMRRADYSEQYPLWKVNHGADKLAGQGAAVLAPDADTIARFTQRKFLAGEWQHTMLEILQARKQKLPLADRCAGFTEAELSQRR